MSIIKIAIGCLIPLLTISLMAQDRENPTGLTNDNPIDKSHPKNHAIKSADEAISQANLYTGFDICQEYSRQNIVCSLTDNISDDKTPFLARFINGQEVWLVKYCNITVGRGSHLANRCFDVILDGVTGKLLSIYSLADDVGQNLSCEEPDAKYFEENWHSVISMQLPDSLPFSNFGAALDEIVFNPSRVRIIRAIYVDIITDKATTKNWWIIIARGSEALLPSFHSAMFGIDGMTGQLISFTNAPQDNSKGRESSSVEKE